MGKAKVDSSVFTVSEGGIVSKGERLFMTLDKYSKIRIFWNSPIRGKIVSDVFESYVQGVYTGQ